MKKILTIFLSFLALTAFGQINIRTGDPRTLISGSDGIIFDPTTGVNKSDSSKMILNITIAQLRASTTLNSVRRYYVTDAGREGTFYRLGSAADDNGVNFHDGNGNNWHRSYDGKNLVASWFGIVGDGATDNTTAWTNMTSYLTGQNLYVTTGQYLINGSQWANIYNCEIICAGRDSVRFFSTTTQWIMAPGWLKHFKMHGFSLYTTFSFPSVDFTHALFGSFGQVSDDVKVYDFKTYNPNANDDAVVFLVQTGTYHGSMRHIEIYDFSVDSCGQTAFTFLNRDSLGLAGLIAGTNTISKTGFDSAYDIRIHDGTISHIGLLGSFGIGITWDGYGYQIYGYNIIFTDCLQEANENTHFWYFTFDNLTFQGAVSGRSWESWGFGPGLIMHGTIRNCHDADTMSTGSSFTGVTDMTIDNTTFKAKNPTKFTNCSNIIGTGNEQFISNDVSALAIISTPGNVSVGNIFTSPYIDNSTFGSNTAAIIFDGKGVNNNKIYNPKVRKGGGGTFTLWKDTAGAQNYVTGFDFGSGVSNSFVSLALPTSATRDTLSNDADLDIKFYQFTGTISQNDTVYLQSSAHTNFAVQDSANHAILICKLSGGSCVLVPSGTVLSIFSDSLNLRTNSATSLAIASVLPAGTTATTQTVGDLTKAVATDSFAAITATAAVNGAHVNGSFILPTLSSKTGIASFTTDTAWYIRVGTNIIVGFHVTAAATTANTTVGLFMTIPTASSFIGGHTLWGNANTIAFSVGSTGSGTGASSSEGVVTGDASGKALLTWNATTTSSVEFLGFYIYHIQ